MQIQSSHCSVAGKQKTNQISQDRVILAQRVQRQLKNVLQGGPLYHEALMLITGKAPIVQSYENIREIPDEKLKIEYHICEYMDDSIVHAYRISGKKKLTIKTDDEIHTEFEDGKYLWNRSQNNDLFLCKWETNVQTVQEMMQKVANKKGKYHVLNNNCQNAAKTTITWIYQEESVARGIDIFKKQEFP